MIFPKRNTGVGDICHPALGTPLANSETAPPHAEDVVHGSGTVDESDALQQGVHHDGDVSDSNIPRLRCGHVMSSVPPSPNASHDNSSDDEEHSHHEDLTINNDDDNDDHDNDNNDEDHVVGSDENSFISNNTSDAESNSSLELDHFLIYLVQNKKQWRDSPKLSLTDFKAAFAKTLHLA